MNHKEVLCKLIQTASSGVLQSIATNRELPFEVCELIMQRRNIDEHIKVGIASRPDCPMELQIRFCANESSNFICNFLKCIVENHNEVANVILPDEVADAIMLRDEMVAILCTHPLISDKAKLKLARKAMALPEAMKQIDLFLRSNWFLEDDCIKEIEAWLKGNLPYEDAISWADFNSCCENLRFLKSPISEDLCLFTIEKFVEQRKATPFSDDEPIYKIACNKSISDYVAMTLAMRCEEYIEPIGQIIKCREQERCNYRNLASQLTTKKS